MDANDVERLTARIATLESFNRRLSQVLVIVLMVAAAAVLMAQTAAPKAPQRKKPAPSPAPKVVEAEQFVLKTSNGRVMATLGLANGGPMLRFVAPSGTDRAVFALDEKGTPRLALLGTDGSQPLTVALRPDGVPQVEVTAPNKSKARLTIGAAGGPSIAFVDPGGTPRLGLDLTTSGPTIALGGKDGAALAVLAVNPETDKTQEGPEFTLSEPNGHQRINMNAVSQQAIFKILDASGRAMVGLQVKAETPALALYSAAGKPLFVKP